MSRLLDEMKELADAFARDHTDRTGHVRLPNYSTTPLVCEVCRTIRNADRSIWEARRAEEHLRSIPGSGWTPSTVDSLEDSPFGSALYAPAGARTYYPPPGRRIAVDPDLPPWLKEELHKVNHALDDIDREIEWQRNHGPEWRKAWDDVNRLLTDILKRVEEESDRPYTDTAHLNACLTRERETSVGRAAAIGTILEELGIKGYSGVNDHVEVSKAIVSKIRLMRAKINGSRSLAQAIVKRLGD